MMGLFAKRPRPAPVRRGRQSRPDLEGLEERKLLYATLGGTWAYGSRITYSFVPDGTNIGGIASNLNATLNAKYATATWKAAFQKAAALWSSYANINLAQVPDDGSPLDTTGNQQNDPRFGDIRIAMIPQNNGAMAFATLPPPFNGGPDAGDIVFNSNINWKVNDNYDLQTVAIHEFGHALGLDHSAVTTADMYPYYSGLKQTITADDIAGIQSVWGAYPADAFDDGSYATATNINGLINPSTRQVALGGQSLAGGADRDYFVVNAPAGAASTMVVSMQSTSLSSVSPRIMVFNSARQLIGQATLPDSYGATATVTINGVTPGAQYYFCTLAASGIGSYGAYGLLVNFGSGTQAPIPPPNTTVAQEADRGGGSTSEAPRGPRFGNAFGRDKIRIGNHVVYGDVLSVGQALGPGTYDPTGQNLPAYPGGPTLGQLGLLGSTLPLYVAPILLADPSSLDGATLSVTDAALDGLNSISTATIDGILQTVRDRDTIISLL